MPILIDIEKPRRWTVKDWRLLPNLRRLQHTEHAEDGNGDWLFLPDDAWKSHARLLRCDHGVYLTNDPDWHGGPEWEEWIAWFCEICQAEFSWYETARDWRRYKFIRPRPLASGEYRNRKDKLFDRLPVYPETFTRPIKLRGRTLTSDLRLQEDPETGKPRLETAGGYVAATLGYSKAGRGHGPDSEADDIRLAWMANHEETAVGFDHEAPLGKTEWTATLPAVDGGITAENWEPVKFPFGVAPDVENFAIVGLSESDLFDERKPNKMPPDIMRRLMEPDRKWLPRIPNARYLISGRRHPDSPRRESFRTFYNFVPSQRAGCLDCDGTFRHHPPLYPIKGSESAGPRPYEIAPIDSTAYLRAHNLEGWQSPLEWVQVKGKWRCRLQGAAILHYGMPTERELARWRRKKEYQRDGGENLVPLRRTKRWINGWQNERKMADLEARLEMYRYGCASNGAESDWFAVDTDTMMQAAWRNFRGAQSLRQWHGVAITFAQCPPKQERELSSVRDTPPRGERWRGPTGGPGGWLRTTTSGGTDSHR